MSNNTVRKYTPKAFIANLLVCCVIPNIMGCIYSLYLLHKKKATSYAYLFIGLFVIFLTYNFYSVDNTLRFLRALNGLSSEEWISGNPLDYLLMFLQTFVGLESSFVFFIYIYTAYIFWYFSLKYNTTCQPKSYFFIIMLLCSLSLRDVIDLLYYSLSVLFTVFYISRKQNRLNIIDLIILTIVVYILHPGLFLLLAPAYALFYISKHFKKSIYYVCLILLYFFGLLLANSHGFSTGINIIDVQLAVFESYTSESKFGIREEALTGITYTLQFYILPVIYFIVCYIATKNSNKCPPNGKHKYIRPNLILSLLQVCVVFYPSFISFITITERILTTMNICAFLFIYKLVLTKALPLNAVRLFVITIFAFITIRCSSAIQLKYIFRKGTYDNIPARCYYMPSILLIDYGRWGFSDDFVRRNSMVFDKFK